MKIMTVLGTRPEIIRLSLIIKKLDECCTHILVHTGQNYSSLLNDIFFEEMEIRKPDYCLGIQDSMIGSQAGKIFQGIETILIKEKPDKLLILGDTNSGLAAIVAERMGIPVYHMEAGNRCFDLKVPEEKNRKIIDAIASYALPYTSKSRENLLMDGVHRQRIFVCGNPIYEVLCSYSNRIDRSTILDKMGIIKDNYILVTIHRSENVDIKGRILEIIKSFDYIQKETGLKIVISVHPRTRNKLQEFGICNSNSEILYCDPFGFIDFVKLEKNARLILTDSGTVQEECCIFNIPTVTIRDTTERPETVECGSNVVSGVNTDRIISCTNLMLRSNRTWEYPDGYIDNNVSNKVVNFIISN